MTQHELPAIKKWNGLWAVYRTRGAKEPVYVSQHFDNVCFWLRRGQKTGNWSFR